MQLRLRYVHREEGTKEVTTTPMCIIEWERRTKKAFTDARFGMEDMTFLAWEATKASGQVVTPFDDWARALTDIEYISDETVPTRGALSAD
jgi:hypothetical protein